MEGNHQLCFSIWTLIPYSIWLLYNTRFLEISEWDGNGTKTIYFFDIFGFVIKFPHKKTYVPSLLFWHGFSRCFFCKKENSRSLCFRKAILSLSGQIVTMPNLKKWLSLLMDLLSFDITLVVNPCCQKHRRLKIISC